jgi:hypothetical protein
MNMDELTKEWIERYMAMWGEGFKALPGELKDDQARASACTGMMIAADYKGLLGTNGSMKPPQKPLPAKEEPKPVEKPKEETKAPPEKPTAPATATEKPPEKPYEPKGELTVGKKAEVKSGPGLDAFMGGETPKHQTFDVTPEDAAKATILPEYDRDNLHWNFCAKHPSTNIEFDNKDGTKHYQKCPECHDYLNADGKRAAYDPETGIPVKKKLPDGSQVPAKTFRKVGK